MTALSGREIVALAIEALDRRAQFAQSCQAAYGASADLQAQITLDDALANLLRILAGRAAPSEADLPRTKDGKVQFTAQMRWQDARELLQVLAGAVRPRLFPSKPQEVEHAA